MRKEIVINKRSYKPAEMTFNNVCRMEEMGAPVTEATTRTMSLLRAYAALCMNNTEEYAGLELEKHIMNGGSFEELAGCLAEAIEESGFFRATREKTEENAPAAAE